jgi:hypothetical protein
VVLTNLDAGHSKPGPIADVVAGLVYPPLLPAKLAPIADTQPALTSALVKLLDQLAAGKDVPSQTADAAAPRIIPDSKSVQQRLANLWPGATLALVKRIPAPNPANQPTSVYRLSKGNDAVLIFIDSLPDAKISALRTTLDREYDW